MRREKDAEAIVEPLVSVIVRTKDRPLLLEEAIRSISQQTYGKIQVCLINDGGEDLDLEHIKGVLGDSELSYAKHRTTLGRSAALNSGFERSKGAYVGILDDDDIYYEEAVERLLEASVSHGDRPVYGKVICRKQDAAINKSEGYLNRIIGKPFSFGKLLFENFIASNAILVPRTWFEKTGPFDDGFEIFEDWDWIIRLADLCEPLFVDTLVGEYRIFSEATIVGKGGAKLHRSQREILLKKHIGKATAGDFLDYVQRVVDGLVLEKDSLIRQLNENMRELEKQNHTKTQWVKDRDRYIGTLGKEIQERDQKITSLESRIHDLEGRIHELERGFHDVVLELDMKKGEIEKIHSSLSWKLTKPLRALRNVKKGHE